MPVLNWIGKDKVVNHDKELPFRVLKPVKELSVGENSENLLVEGDNLEALKALMPFYYNKIDFIYIDPPYNTGSEKWIYNDKVNSPQIKQWISKIVGPEGDDLSRHDKWLCMMYPRLKLLKDLLSEEGAIFISIDDNEVHNLRIILDEIFGESNFISMLSVENNPKGRKNSNYISVSSEYCLIYAKNKDIGRFNEVIPKDEKDMIKDENGNYIHNSGKRVIVGENSFNKKVTNYTSDKHYSVYFHKQLDDLTIKKENRLDEVDHSLITKGYKRYISYLGDSFIENTYTSEKLRKLFDEDELDIKENKIYEKNFNSLVRLKSILINKKYKAIKNNQTVEYEIDLKSTSAQQMLKKMLGKEIFSFPKNVSFLKLLIQLFPNKNAIVLDSFAGSGTTGQAVMEQNKEDGGNRRFILVELEEDIAKNVTAKRLKKVSEGYSGVKGTGQGFEYLELNGELYDESGFVNPSAKYDDMAAYIYFTETKNYLDIPSIKNPYIGSHGSTSYFLFFEGKGNNILDEKTLKKTEGHIGNKVIYADKCLIDDEHLIELGITFKQIPYELKKY